MTSLRTALVALLLLTSCKDHRMVQKKTAAAYALPVGSYPGGPAGLQALFTDILKACQKDERQRVHDLLASLIMTQPELAALLGPQQAERLWARYQQQMESMVNLGAVELVAYVYDKKLDEVQVATLTDIPAAERSKEDTTLLGALLPSAPPIYRVRLRKKGVQGGLRYDFFSYQEGRWRTGGQLAQTLTQP